MMGLPHGQPDGAALRAVCKVDLNLLQACQLVSTSASQLFSWLNAGMLMAPFPKSLLTSPGKALLSYFLRDAIPQCSAERTWMFEEAVDWGVARERLHQRSAGPLVLLTGLEEGLEHHQVWH
jgi:hypothetical protein